MRHYTETKIAEWNESYTEWLYDMQNSAEEEEDELDDEELTYYVRKK